MKNIRFKFSNSLPVSSVPQKPVESVSSSSNNAIKFPDVSNNKKLQTQIRIKTIGVGGCGGNAINTMLKNTTDKSVLLVPNFIAINTDRQALSISNASTKIQIGTALTKGVGSGGIPNVGKKALEENIDDVKTVIKNTDVLFITCGMGGGTGTGASPSIAKISKLSGAFTIGIVTLPFDCEGDKRALQATEGIAEFKKHTDALLILPNQKLFSMVAQETPLENAFELVNQTIAQIVQGISEIILLPELLNVDFADVRSIMSQEGDAFVGIGTSKADNQLPKPESQSLFVETRALRSLQQAINSPFLNKKYLRGAMGALINITADQSLTLFETKDVIATVRGMIHPDANIIFGVHIDKRLEDEVRVTLITTGIKQHYNRMHKYAGQNLKTPTFQRNNSNFLSLKGQKTPKVFVFPTRQSELKS